MSELCKCGSGKKVKGCGAFKFSYKGLNMTATKTGSECEDCSFDRRNIIESIDKYAERLIDRGLGIKINWDFYCEFMGEEHGENSQSLSDILVALGYFSIDPENNWMITDGSININPSWHSSPLYFTSGLNALIYAKLKFSDTMYNWDIRHISRVIKKSDIFK